MRTLFALSSGTNRILTTITTSTDRRKDYRISGTWHFHLCSAQLCAGTRLVGRLLRVSALFGAHFSLIGPFSLEAARLVSRTLSAGKAVRLPEHFDSDTMLTPKCPGDTEGGWEKSLPSVENRLMTLKSSFESYTALDDMTAH